MTTTPPFPPAPATRPIPRDDNGHTVAGAGLFCGLTAGICMLLSLVPAIFSMGTILGFLLAIIAIPLGHVAYSRTKRDPSIRRGWGIAGFTLGYVVIFLTFPFMLIAGAIYSASK